MSTRRLLTTLVATLAIAAPVAGCGGDDDSASGSLDASLAFVPKNAPVVVTFDTDTSGDQYKRLQALLGKFPFAGQIQAQLTGLYSRTGGDYTRDIKPLLGNPIVIALPDARSITDDNSDDTYVVAFQAKSADALKRAVDRSSQQQKAGQLEGGDLYQASDGAVTWVKGDKLVSANSRPQLAAAIGRSKGSDHMAEGDFGAAFAGLPADPVARVYGDVQALLASDPDSTTARQVKWVAGLRKFAVTASAEGDGLAFDSNIATQGVSDADLPLAAGGASPAVARYADYSIGLRNLTQTIRFVETTAMKTDPAGSARFQKQKAAFAGKQGIDVDRDLFGQLTGDTTIAGRLDGTVSLRASVKDPAKLRATLDKLADAGRVGDTTYSRSGDLVRSEGDGTPAYFGMVGDVFVEGPTPEAAKEIAPISARPLPGTKGALTLVADGEAIAKRAIQQSGQNQSAGLFAGPLGDVTGYASASPGGIRIHAKLKIE